MKKRKINKLVLTKQVVQHLQLTVISGGANPKTRAVTCPRITCLAAC